MWAGRPLSAEEMAVVEQNAVALGVTVDALMENAGRAVAEEATRHLPRAPARVAVVAGTGNNGGDGTCAAYYLAQWGHAPEIWIVRRPSEIRSRPALRCFERAAQRCPVHVGPPTPADLAGSALVVDAVLGTGQTSPLRSPIREAVAAIRESGIPTLAVDLPTGTRDPEGVRPTWTVALTTPKSEMDPATAGEVTVRDIGIPREAWARTGPGEFLFFPTPERRGARGRSGRVVVVGGGPYAGAPALAALAALRSGAERVTVLAPAGAAERVQSFSPNLVVEAHGASRFRPDDAEGILDFVRAAHPSAVLVGMGAGTDPGTVEALSRVEAGIPSTVPLVVDADGLAALPTAETATAPRSLFATPNFGEFVRYFGGPSAGSPDENRSAARQAAAARRVFLIVKGPVDLLSDGDAVLENAHHHPAMTVGGMGDVLGGVVAALLAQGLSPWAAARLGTWWTGEAGIRAAARRGFGLVATDAIDELPGALVDGLDRVRPGG